MHALRTSELLLEPLVAAHAEAMFDVLSEPGLYRYLDYPPPPTVEHLRGVYARVESRWSPDRSQCWLNWIVRPHGAAPIGYVQITLTAHHDAWLGFVFASRYWGRGFARQASQAVIEHLPLAYQVNRFLATVETQNERSIGLLERLGFHSATGAELAGRDLSPSERLFVR